MREQAIPEDLFRIKLNAVIEDVRRRDLPTTKRTSQQVLKALAAEDYAEISRKVSEPGERDCLSEPAMVASLFDRVKKLEAGDTGLALQILEGKITDDAATIHFAVHSSDHFINDARMRLAQSLADLEVLQPEHPEQPASPGPHPTS